MKGSKKVGGTLKDEEEDDRVFEESLERVKLKIRKRDRRGKQVGGKNTAVSNRQQQQQQQHALYGEEVEEDPPCKTPNCFILFGNRLRQCIKRELPDLSNNEVSIHLGRMWGMLSEEQRRPFKLHAAYLRHKQLRERREKGKVMGTSKKNPKEEGVEVVAGVVANVDEGRKKRKHVDLDSPSFFVPDSPTSLPSEGESDDGGDYYNHPHLGGYLPPSPATSDGFSSYECSSTPSSDNEESLPYIQKRKKMRGESDFSYLNMYDENQPLADHCCLIPYAVQDEPSFFGEQNIFFFDEYDPEEDPSQTDGCWISSLSGPVSPLACLTPPSPPPPLSLAETPSPECLPLCTDAPLEPLCLSSGADNRPQQPQLLSTSMEVPRLLFEEYRDRFRSSLIGLPSGAVVYMLPLMMVDGGGSSSSRGYLPVVKDPSFPIELTPTTTVSSEHAGTTSPHFESIESWLPELY